jgi:hypothetical protein
MQKSCGKNKERNYFIDAAQEENETTIESIGRFNESVGYRITFDLIIKQ